MHPVDGSAYLNIHVYHTDMPFHVLTTSLTWVKNTSEIPKRTQVYTVLHANKQCTLVPRAHAYTYSHVLRHMYHRHVPSHTDLHTSLCSLPHSFLHKVCFHSRIPIPSSATGKEVEPLPSSMWRPTCTMSSDCCTSGEGSMCLPPR